MCKYDVYTAKSSKNLPCISNSLNVSHEYRLQMIVELMKTKQLINFSTNIFKTSTFLPHTFYLILVSII